IVYLKKKTPLGCFDCSVRYFTIIFLSAQDGIDVESVDPSEVVFVDEINDIIVPEEIFQQWPGEAVALEVNGVEYAEDDFIPIEGTNIVEYEEEDVDRLMNRGRRKPPTIVQCEVCGVVVKHPSKIEAHMRTHTGEKPFECEICGAKFTQRTPMLNHVRRHLGQTPYLCGYGCGKSFVNNAQKNAHELRH
ncbi:unnamed protein product, partial [Strongylus vulgaris]